MSYKHKFKVEIVLTPGNGYENHKPYMKTMRQCIKRAIEEGLSPSRYIAGKVTKITAIKPAHRKPESP